jgi:hypothetical protein
MATVGAEAVAVGRLTELPAGTPNGVAGDTLEGVREKFSAKQFGGSPAVATVRLVTSIGTELGLVTRTASGCGGSPG